MTKINSDCTIITSINTDSTSKISRRVQGTLTGGVSIGVSGEALFCPEIPEAIFVRMAIELSMYVSTLLSDLWRVCLAIKCLARPASAILDGA